MLVYRAVYIYLLGLLAIAGPGPGRAFGDHAITRPASLEQLRQSTSADVTSRLTPLLRQYCGEACQLVDVEVSLAERLPEANEFGFESVAPQQPHSSFYVERVTAHVQLDKRVTQANRERLTVILSQHLRRTGLNTELNWLSVELPRFGDERAEIESIVSKLRARLEAALTKIVQKYCPDTCIIADLQIKSQAISGDEAQAYDGREVFFEEATQTFVRILGVEVSLSLDAKLPEEQRANIVSLMQAKTRFVSPIHFEPNVSPFPESFAEQKERLSGESSDPYGLEKLRRMLVMFKELAGTKEIISTLNSTSSQSSTSKEESKHDSSSSSEASSSEKAEGNWFVYAIALIFVFGLVAFIIIRFAQANRDAKMMMNAVGSRPDTPSEGAATPGGGQPSSSSLAPEAALSMRLAHSSLKEELVEVCLRSPKVAKETFSRLLQEDGVEEAAKYVHIFGKMIIFELLSDASLQRSLYELSEYYHKSHFQFTIAAEHELLVRLKTKVTANEIRILASQTIDQFDFLLKLDPSHIFRLIEDESPQIQSIVLTQLSPQRRRAVFEMFEGNSKVKLMNELCRADAIPKEFLYNVALALSRKVLAKPEFDTQSMRSSDIILELLERASLVEQKSLMASLAGANTEAARLIKLKLVTVHMLPYLKDGHLLELILGLEREDLVCFLAACPDNIQRLLITHAPQELAQSWAEDLAGVSGVDEGRYRLVEMMILSKVRQLASNGAINLLEVNELIFATPGETRSASSQAQAQILSTRKNFVA